MCRGLMKIALHLEELKNIQLVRPGNAGDIGKFADLLETIVINLKETGRQVGLGKGTLCTNL